MGQLVLARGGSTSFDANDRLLGNLDVSLTDAGRAELKQWASQLAPLNIDVVIAAGGESTRQSAEFLADALGCKCKVLEGLPNQDLGLWQGLSIAELKKKHPKVFKRLEESPLDICPPNGEPVEEVLERIRKILRPVLKKHQTQTLLLVAPDPLRQIIRSYLAAVPLETFLPDDDQPAWESINYNGLEK